MDIKLNLINRSNDANNTSFVIFGKNEAMAYSEVAIAWQVINNLGAGDNHPFTYSQDFSFAVIDSYGNFSQSLAAFGGEQLHIYRGATGDEFAYSRNTALRGVVEIVNDLPTDAVTAQAYLGGKLFAQEMSLAPGEKASFAFMPRLWIGVVSQIREGAVMNSAVLSAINTELSLLGIKSADIVISGGGSGADAQPFTFELDNITRDMHPAAE